MDCDMCGREQATLKATVEGSVLSLCDGCSKFGKIVGRVATAAAAAKKKEGKTAAFAEEESEFVVTNLGPLLKQKRELLGLKQDEFAKKIAVKGSVLHKMETGTMKPGIEEAKRLGKLLGLRLIERVDIAEGVVPKPKKDQLTLGDMIKLRKR